jgi:hypothetical protein
MADSGQMEVVNITKIRDGFFIGDGVTASNLEVILTFKITHIINTSPTQVMNTYENIGVKYLSINWSENNNQVIKGIKKESF